MKIFGSAFSLFGVTTEEMLKTKVEERLVEVLGKSTWYSVSVIAGKRPSDLVIRNISEALHNFIFPSSSYGGCSDIILGDALFQIGGKISATEFSHRYSHDLLLENLYAEDINNSEEWLGCAYVTILLHYRMCCVHETLFDLKYLMVLAQRTNSIELRGEETSDPGEALISIIKLMVEISEE
jgi:hypothetical protein